MMCKVGPTTSLQCLRWSARKQLFRKRTQEAGTTGVAAGGTIGWTGAIGCKTDWCRQLLRENGTTLLLQGLQHLLPLRKQAALELYHAGTKDGILSRQHGEPMASYCLRRQSWWTQLQELDPEIKCSDGILGEQFLIQAGLGSAKRMEGHDGDLCWVRCRSFRLEGTSAAHIRSCLRMGCPVRRTQRDG